MFCDSIYSITATDVRVEGRTVGEGMFDLWAVLIVWFLHSSLLSERRLSFSLLSVLLSMLIVIGCAYADLLYVALDHAITGIVLLQVDDSVHRG